MVFAGKMGSSPKISGKSTFHVIETRFWCGFKIVIWLPLLDASTAAKGQASSKRMMSLVSALAGGMRVTSTVPIDKRYPLVNIQKTMENHHF